VDFNNFISTAFLGLLSGGVYILWEMKNSIATLDNKIGIIIAKSEQASHDLLDHESRIRVLEKTK